MENHDFSEDTIWMTVYEMSISETLHEFKLTTFKTIDNFNKLLQYDKLTLDEFYSS